MAPQQRHSRPSSGPPSPTKGSPRKSGDRRSGDPRRRSAAPQTDDDDNDYDDSPRKQRARDSDPDPRRRERRRSSAQRTPNRGSPTKERGSPRKDDARERRESGSPTKKPRAREQVRAKKGSSTGSSSNALSADSLAKLDAANARGAERDRKQRGKDKKAAAAAGAKEKVVTGRVVKERTTAKRARRESGGELGGLMVEKEAGTPSKRKAKGARSALRSASNSVLELGRRGGYAGDEEADRRRKKKRLLCWGAVLLALLLLVLVPVGVLVVGKQGGGGGGSSGGDDGDGSSDGSPDNSNLNGIDPSSVPASAKGSWLDPFSWYDTQDFNVTFTAATVGGLPVMGLNSTWDDSARANDNVAPLNKPFGYGTTPIRGVNVGGWLAVEPFITPSLFAQFDSKENVVDEYTLCQKLGPSAAKSTLEQHYSQFIGKQVWADIRAAGFDHVRIPYSYWAVATYSGDPYVSQVAWRYLLRGIEYARQNGLRVNLDLHGLPGSQNGWNHSGRQGVIGWLNGTDGALNAQRSLDLHKQLSAFFAQDRYTNVVAIYGLVNEPKMISLDTDAVVSWTTSAVNIVRASGMEQWIAFGDGFLGLPNWQGKLQGLKNLVLDAHEYVIFNGDQIAFDHQDKLNYACSGWAGQMQQSMNTATGFGPTLCGEWSQADTDCAQYLNNVNVGARWIGTLNVGDPSQDVLTPSCPLKTSQCSCNGANADPSSYSSAYKQWLLYNAEAQMQSFELGFGWFYWTWLTESATQWSWKLGMDAGILPSKVWDRDFNCSTGALNQPDWGSQGLPETY